MKERQDIIESGYIEDEMEFFIGNVQKLVQAELDRHFDTTKVVKNYYACLDGKGPLDPFEASEVEVLPPADVTILFSKRVIKLCSNALQSKAQKIQILSQD